MNGGQVAGLPGAYVTIQSIARLCHEVNRAYCVSLGDLSQLPWEMAPDWQRQSSVNGVALAVQNPDATPETMHEAWMLAKQNDGWRYGASKDPLRKQHPCMVPYDKLPPAQRAKDHIFLALVRAINPETVGRTQ